MTLFEKPIVVVSQQTYDELKAKIKEIITTPLKSHVIDSVPLDIYGVTFIVSEKEAHQDENKDQ